MTSPHHSTIIQLPGCQMRPCMLTNPLHLFLFATPPPCCSFCPYGRLPIRPGPLTAVQATPTSLNRARITWRNPANQACYRYVDIVIQSPGLRDERRRSSRSVEVLRNLDPRRVYTVTLVPVSSLFGAGPPVRVQVQTGRPAPARPTDCTPDERRAPQPVTDLTVTTDVGPG